MTILQSIILGIIQGATEFIPISSSGHLVLAPYIFGWNIPPSETFVFDVLVQVATLIAVFVYFYKEILLIIKSFIKGILSKSPFEDENSKLGWYIIVATIPAGIIGILIKSRVEDAFNSPKYTSIALIITGVLLFIGELINRKSVQKKSEIGFFDALWMGLFQVLAIFPGISRSGSTITGGLLRNVNRRDAAKFSFLMSIPIMLAAGALALVDLINLPNIEGQFPIYLAGFVTSAIVGYFSIKWLLQFLSKRPMYLFAIYCIILGSGVLISLA